jgi:V/A-type H+-transporting ATPase subunit C
VPDFPYINARVRAMRSRLLDAARVDELLAAPSFEAFVHALGSTPYGRDLSEAQTRYQGLAAVDEALARNFRATTTKILSFADGQAKALIGAVLLRWDLANIRAILRGKHTSRSEEEIMASVLPAGPLGDAPLRDVVRQPDVGAVAGALEAMGHPLAPGVAAALAGYQADQDLMRLELSLDRVYAEVVLAAARAHGHNEEVLRRTVQAEIDAFNVKAAVKLARLEEGLDEASRRRFFIPGGAVVDEKLFLGLSARETLEGAWQVLGVRGFAAGSVPDDLTEFERSLDSQLARQAAHRYLGDPLGLDVVVGYLALKYNEVVNLRLIARSKAFGIPRDVVRKEMALA